MQKVAQPYLDLLNENALDILLAVSIAFGALGVVMIASPSVVNFVIKPKTQMFGDRVSYIARCLGILVVVSSAFMFYMALANKLFSK